MEGGMSCIKYLMFFFNLLIFLAGAALLGVGIWVAVSGESFKQIVSEDPRIFSAVYVIIAVGGALFLIGFLGCCGAVNENRCLLGTFFTLVLILFLIEIVGIALVFVFAPEFEKTALASISNETSTAVDEGWNAIQTAFQCCGVRGASDWEGDVPASCYQDSDTSKPEHTEGCKAVVVSMFWIVAGIAIGILFVELLAMIFSCCLYRSIGESKGYA